MDVPTVTVLDGGLSTALEQLGATLGHRLWTADLLDRDPERIVAAHLAFLRAGARVLITSSYQASRQGLLAEGVDTAHADRLLRRTTALAREAVERFADEDPAGAAGTRVAASVGPYGAVLADGSEYTGRYPVGGAALVAFHAERLAVLVDTGPDLLACETIPGRAEGEALVAALRRVDGPPCWISFTCADDVRTRTGEPVEEAVRAVLDAPGLFAVGVNCTPPDAVAALLRRIAGVTDLPLVAYPNAGGDWDGSAWHGQVADPTALVDDWVSAGARLVGGCCGVGPDGVARITAAVARRGG